MTPELRTFLWMLMARQLHTEKILEVLISSENMPTSVRENPLLVKYTKLNTEQLANLRTVADRILNMYDLPEVIENDITEYTTQELGELPNKPIDFFEAKTGSFAIKADDFKQINEDLSEKQAVS